MPALILTKHSPCAAVENATLPATELAANTFLCSCTQRPSPRALLNPRRTPPSAPSRGVTLKILVRASKSLKPALPKRVRWSYNVCAYPGSSLRLLACDGPQ
jgi:hypothetical protein